MSDITIGDFWGIQDSKNINKVEKEKGISLVLINTKKGKEFFNKCATKIFCEERKTEEAINGNAHLRRSSAKNNFRLKFREKYNAYNEKVTKLKDKVDRYENSKQSYDVRNDVEKLIIEFESCKHFDNAILKKLVEKIEINKNNTINIMFKI